MFDLLANVMSAPLLVPMDINIDPNTNGLSIPGLHADALSWAAEAKKMGQAEPSTKGGPLVESSNLTRLG